METISKRSADVVHRGALRKSSDVSWHEWNGLKARRNRIETVIQSMGGQRIFHSVAEYTYSRSAITIGIGASQREIHVYISNYVHVSIKFIIVPTPPKKKRPTHWLISKTSTVLRSNSSKYGKAARPS